MGFAVWQRLAHHIAAIWVDGGVGIAHSLTHGDSMVCVVCKAVGDALAQVGVVGHFDVPLFGL